MHVETYEVPEVTGPEGTPESDAEAAELVEQLDLEGQRTLLSAKAGRFPYRRMTADEQQVYGVLLATRTPLKKYRSGPVPLRVLQVAAHAVTCEIDGRKAFTELTVWHPADAEVKDPILVGVHKAEAWRDEFYLLARWGDVLAPLAELRRLAGGRHFQAVKAKLGEIVAEAQARLATLTEDSALAVPMPSASF